MKFPVEKCECGLDLTKATPVRVRLGQGPNGEPVGGCPNCWRTYFMVEEKPAEPTAATLSTPKPAPATPVTGSKKKTKTPSPK